MKVAVNNLLLKEGILTDNFNRYDICVRYYSIRQHIEAQPNSFNLYLKMQEARVGHRLNVNLCIEIFKKYITFYLFYKGVRNSRGIEVDIKPIPIADDTERMIDGCHRLACHIYFDEEFIEVEKVGKVWGKGVNYSRDWFIKNGFNETDLILLDNIQKEIIERRNIK